MWYGGIGSNFLLSKILIDPSVVKIFPYYCLIHMENIRFFILPFFDFIFILRWKGDL